MRAARRPRLPRRRPTGEGGSAIADFAMVSALVSLVFLVVFQVGLALHVRNTLVSCASEGARLGARADAQPADGAVRARDLIATSLSDRFAQDVTVDVVDVGGVQVVVVRVSSPLPVLGLLGPDRQLDIVGRAFLESQ